MMVGAEIGALQQRFAGSCSAQPDPGGNAAQARLISMPCADLWNDAMRRGIRLLRKKKVRIRRSLRTGLLGALAGLCAFAPGIAVAASAPLGDRVVERDREHDRPRRPVAALLGAFETIWLWHGVVRQHGLAIGHEGEAVLQINQNPHKVALREGLAMKRGALAGRQFDPNTVFRQRHRLITG